jgi:hypothetical protein
MQSGSRDVCRDSGCIENEITDLPEERVGRPISSLSNTRASSLIR